MAVNPAPREARRPGLHIDSAQGEVIVDYSAAAAGGWIADGLAFGKQPRPAGAWRLGADGEHPLAWQTPQAVADTAGLGATLPGMIRTPTFVISQPHVWYFARGSAEVFLVVDSHRMIAGPLHGGTRHNADLADWNWRNFDVKTYQGQRAHVEFRAARPTNDFAIAACVQSPSPPAMPRANYAALVEQLAEQPVELPAEPLAKQSAAEQLGEGGSRDVQAFGAAANGRCSPPAIRWAPRPWRLRRATRRPASWRNGSSNGRSSSAGMTPTKPTPSDFSRNTSVNAKRSPLS